MAIAGMDLSRKESGIGAGTVVTVTGTPFTDPVTYQNGFSDTSTIIGNADGYDISSATGIRLYYDIELDGAGYVELLAVPMAASPGPGGVPVAEAGASIAFDPDVLSLGSSSLEPKSGALRFTADRRGSVLFPRTSLLLRFEVRTDVAGGKVALAVQSILDGGGE